MTTLRLPRFRLFAVALLLAAGCSRPAHGDKIVARDDGSFDAWIAEHRDVLTLDETHELLEARQQLRFKTMTQHPGLMSADFANALYSEIDGKTVPQLLTTSYELQVERAEVDLKNYQPLVAQYQAYDQRRDLTDEQRHEVKEKQEDLARKVAAREAELAHFRQRLAELRTDPAAAP